MDVPFWRVPLYLWYRWLSLWLQPCNHQQAWCVQLPACVPICLPLPSGAPQVPLHRGKFPRLFSPSGMYQCRYRKHQFIKWFVWVISFDKVNVCNCWFQAYSTKQSILAKTRDELVCPCNLL